MRVRGWAWRRVQYAGQKQERLHNGFVVGVTVVSHLFVLLAAAEQQLAHTVSIILKASSKV